MKMRSKQFILLMLVFLLISSVSALSVSTNPVSISETALQGQSKQVFVSYDITGVTSDSTVNINLGNLPTPLSSIISSNINSISVTNGTDKSGIITLTLNVPQSTSPATYSGNIFIGSTKIPLSLIVNQNTVVEEEVCEVDIFPTVLTNIKIKQGETKSRSVQLTIPSCFEKEVSVNNVALYTNEKPIEVGELSLGKIQPGQSVMIPLTIDADDVSTGQYTDNLEFLLYSDGKKLTVPTTSISVLVSAGISPLTNTSFNDLPTCSLSSIDLNLNSTYTMTCTRNNGNIAIRPTFDSFFLKGVSVEETSNQFIYKFMAKNLGTTKFKADFVYKDSPIGSPFEQEIRISPSGNSPVSGVTLDLRFYPELYNYNGNATVRIMDNSTKNFLDNGKLYLDGLELSNNILSGLEKGKNYELRASVPGFLDYVTIIDVSEKPISFTTESSYDIGDALNFTTTPEGATVYLDGSAVAMPFVLNNAGVRLLKVTKEGYSDTYKNITVNSQAQIIYETPEEDIKKGESIRVELDKVRDITVYYRKNLESQSESVQNINSNTVNVDLDKSGIYDVYADGSLVKSYKVDSSGFFSGKTFVWGLVIFAVLVLVVIIIRKSNANKSGDSLNKSSFVMTSNN